MFAHDRFAIVSTVDSVPHQALRRSLAIRIGVALGVLVVVAILAVVALTRSATGPNGASATDAIVPAALSQEHAKPSSPALSGEISQAPAAAASGAAPTSAPRNAVAEPQESQNGPDAKDGNEAKPAKAAADLDDPTGRHDAENARSASSERALKQASGAHAGPAQPHAIAADKPHAARAAPADLDAAKPDEQAAATARRAPATSAMSAAAGASKPARGPHLQAGMFLQATNAQALKANLEAQGFPVYIESRVHIGPFRNRKEAERAREKLREMGVATVLIAQ